MSQCSWHSSDNRSQCRWPGPFSSGCHGDGRWLCAWHWSLSGEDKFTRASVGDEIVNQSQEWDGGAESYLALRAQASEAKRKPVAHANPPESHGRNEPKRISELLVVPEIVGEVEGEF